MKSLNYITNRAMNVQLRDDAHLEIDEDILISEKTWNREASSVNKAGFVDGAFDGKDSVFQKGFDDGFAEGMKMGLQLGKYYGVLTAVKNTIDELELPEEVKTCTNNLDSDQLLSVTPRGHCILCKDPSNMNNTTPEIIDKQKYESNTVLENLSEQYKCVGQCFNIELANKIQ